MSGPKKLCRRVALALLVCAASASPAFALDCFREIDPLYLQTDPNSFFHFQTRSDALALRASMINFVWHQPALPTALPQNVVHGISTAGDLDTQGMTNLARIDRLDVPMDAGFTAYVYVFWPTTPNSRLAIFHQGHSPTLNELGGKEVVQLLVDRGYTVLGFHMPMFGPNTGPIAPQEHGEMAAFESSSLNPFKLFLHPVAVALNYMATQAQFTDISMIGLSGGGWTTEFYSALDPRITTSISVAGSLPLYLRVGVCALPGDFGDYEQGMITTPTVADFYANTASYLDLYALGALEPGRTQMQVFNQFDPCCFGGIRSQAYAQALANKVAAVGGGRVGFGLDSSHYEHSISSWALYHVILEVLEPPLPQPDPEPGLSALLSFDEQDPDRAFDHSGNGWTGALLGTAARVPGLSGQAIDLDGHNGYVTFSAPVIGTRQTFTISLWVNSRAWQGALQRPLYVEANSATGATRNYLGIFGDQMTPGRVFFDQYPNSGGFLVSQTVLSLNTWHHIVYTQTPTYRAIYVDGVLDTQDTAPEPYLGPAPDTVALGYRPLPSGALALNGLLDDVRMYNRSLSSAEIAALYAAHGTVDTIAPMVSVVSPTAPLPATTTSTTLAVSTNEAAHCRYAVTPGVAYASMANALATTDQLVHSTVLSGLTPGTTSTFYVRCQDTAGNVTTADLIVPVTVLSNPLAAWTFDDTGSTVQDSSGNGQTGQLVGPVRVPGLTGSALDFHGGTDRVTFSAPVIGTLQSFTISLWVNSRAWQGALQRPLYVEANGATGATRNYLGIFGDQFAPAGTVFFDQFPNSDGFLVSHTALSLNTWHHIVYTQTPTRRALYIDGVLDNQDSTLEPYLGPTPDTVALGYRPTPSGAYAFDGLLDDVRMYNRSLSSAEIAALYAAHGTVDTIAPVVSVVSPTAPLPATTTSATLAVSTNEAAHCRYAVTPGVAYASMANALATTDQLVHSTVLSGLTPGTTSTFYVRCQDTAGNVTTADLIVPVTVLSNPLAAWTFDDTGSTVQDSSGNGQTGQLVGPVRVPGLTGSALDFHGGTDRVTFSAPVIGTLQSFTISLWVNSRAWQGALQRPLYVEANGATGATRNYLGIFGDQFAPAGTVFFDQFPNSGGFLVSHTALSLNTWHHIVYTQTPTRRAIYIDGVLDIQDTAPEPYLGPAPDTVALGYRPLPSGALALNGLLDNVNIYDHALSDAEILALYTGDL